MAHMRFGMKFAEKAGVAGNKICYRNVLFIIFSCIVLFNPQLLYL